MDPASPPSSRCGKITSPGGVPVFPCDDEQQRERVSVLLARILQAVVHDLENGDFILVRH